MKERRWIDRLQGDFFKTECCVTANWIFGCIQFVFATSLNCSTNTVHHLSNYQSLLPNGSVSNPPKLVRNQKRAKLTKTGYIWKDQFRFTLVPKSYLASKTLLACSLQVPSTYFRSKRLLAFLFHSSSIISNNKKLKYS